VNRYVWVIVGLGAGCNGWPRFGHLPDDDFVAVDGTVSLRTVSDEARDGDRPDRPAGLPDNEGETGRLFEGLRWRGALGWDPAVGIGESTFDCPIEPLPLTYPGDVDFVRFRHLGGSLCVVVATPLSGEAQPSQSALGGEPRFDCPDGIGRPLWEAPLYRIGDDGQCPSGRWLNADDGELPVALGLRGDTLFFPNVPAGDHALFLAAVCGRYAGAGPCDETFSDDRTAECVPYELAVAVVPGRAACDTLYQDLREAL